MPGKTEQHPKVVLITGANKGIGLETAQQLARRRWHVVIGVRKASAGKQAVAAIEKENGEASLLEVDVSDSKSISRAAAEFEQRQDYLDVLINNAGIYPDEGLTLLTISRRQLTETFQTNTFGPVEMTQAFLPFLRKAKGSRVINMSSGYGQIEGLLAHVPSYCLSKLALNGVTLMLAQALKPDGIAVNSMSPGWVRTDMGGAAAPRSVEEGADTAVWLAADAPQKFTGKFFRDRKEIPW
jgi:NAD(P)-dependent dehydrogenase (short-subunit alcohol dehydrogenase family)